MDRQAAIAAIISVVDRELGVSLRDYRRESLSRRVGNRMKLAGCRGFEEYLALLESGNGEARRLLEYLTIKWSRFFRDEPVYARLKTQILPEIVSRSGEHPSIWSAGCARGEEAYSIRILLQDAIPGRASASLILGTDIDPSALDAARTALYTAFSLDGVPDGLIRDFFSAVPHRAGTLYRLREDIRGSVRFLQHDLLTAAGPPEGRRFDLVLCRNVVIYFEQRVHSRVIDLLTMSLVSGGYLCLGEAEHLSASHEGLFDTIDKKNRIYRKR